MYVSIAFTKTCTRKKIVVMGVNWGLIGFLWESPHVTFICDFGWLPNRTSLRECLLDSISTARVSSWGGFGARIPIENKLSCTFIGSRNINMHRKEPRIALSSVLPVPLRGLMIPTPPLQLLLPTPLLHTDGRRVGIKVYITAEK